jgi:formate dehydrogenase major subunit
MPDNFPGYQSVTDDAARLKFERAWGVSLPSKIGMESPQLVEAIYKGDVRALYLGGEDMISADANAGIVAGAFERLDLFVVQDIFFTETCRYADVVFPASPALEKDGTFTNTERRIQRVHQALPELGDSRADWKITQSLAQRMGAHWNYSHPSEIMAELASLAPIYAGCSYERLEGWRTLQWPVHADGTDTPVLYLDRFAFPDGKARLYPLSYHEPFDQPNAEFDLFLNNGRELEHFHEGNLTHRVAGIHMENPERYLEISPELARERHISSGRWVRLTSRYGSLRVKVLVTSRVSGKQVFLPLTSQDGPVNILTGTHMDTATNTPAYKETAVKMEVLPEQGDDPLMKVNFRNTGKRTPQMGVEIERKWKRVDYRFPGAPKLVQIGGGNR